MTITIAQGAFLPVPPLLGGAVEKIWFALGKAFAKRGHDVFHISRRYPGTPEAEVIDGVMHLRVSGFNAPKSPVAAKALDLLYSCRVRSVLPRSDILVTNTFWLPLVASEKAHGKIYVHVARYPKRQMWMYSKAARLQTVSSHIANVICHQTPSLASRVGLVPNLIPDITEPPKAMSSRQKRILYVGRVHPEKGLHLLVDAFAEIKSRGVDDWRLCVVGPSEVESGGGGLGYLRSLQQRSGAAANSIDWVGPIFDPALLNRCYEESSVFVYPSLAERGETFGLAPLEAMAHGCPPVVSSLKCFSDFIQNGQSCWVFDHRAASPKSELANTLHRIISNPSELQRASSVSLDVARRYQLSKVAELYLEDFGRVLAAQ